MSVKNQTLIGLKALGYKMSKNGSMLDPEGNICASYDVAGYKRHTTKKVFGKPVSVSLHRFQAYLKFGDKIFEKGIQVRHLNNVKSDNSWDNLELGTPSQNFYDNSPEVMHKIRTTRTNAAKNIIREKNLDVWVPIYIGRYVEGLSYNKLNEIYGVGKSSLSFHFGKGSKTVEKEYRDLILSEAGINISELS